MKFSTNQSAAGCAITNKITCKIILGAQKFLLKIISGAALPNSAVWVKSRCPRSRGNVKSL